jgi:23S rRNA (cytosine1962-C5)-methyltransferase
MLCLSDEPFFKKNELVKTLTRWSTLQWEKALQIRTAINSSRTSAYRLINGEGDGLPGLVIDLYSNTAVIKFDHSLFEEKIWSLDSLVAQLCDSFPHLDSIYLKRKNEDQEKGKVLFGDFKEEVQFKENNLLFSANIKEGSKTGFFLDQRDNRALIKQFANNKSVLNLFSYTGGFSVYAAAGGAKSVTSVDIAKPAIAALNKNFEINELKVSSKNIAADAFLYLDEALQNKQKFDLIINDPPSFAPNAKSIPQATVAYTKVFSDSLKLVQSNGYFAASSCSSHISTTMFIEIVKESFSKARRRGTLVQMGDQPFDHPYPLAMDELRYLKFALFRVD